VIQTQPTSQRRPRKRFSFLLAIVAYVPFEIALSLLHFYPPLVVDVAYILIAWAVIHEVRLARRRRQSVEAEGAS
jgi:Flp pilus assembly protein TadB